MLRNARLYIDELQEKAYGTWYDTKYQFYYAGGYFNEIDLSDENRWAFVSIDDNDEVIGYITFRIATDTNSVMNFGAMSLCDNLNITFARDVAGLVNDIFCKYHFNRMEWWCVDGNPVLRSYKKFCEKHGGTVVAHEHECVRTIDGVLRDSYSFEILARNYIPSR